MAQYKKPTNQYNSISSSFSPNNLLEMANKRTKYREYMKTISEYAQKNNIDFFSYSHPQNVNWENPCLWFQKVIQTKPSSIWWGVTVNSLYPVVIIDIVNWDEYEAIEKLVELIKNSFIPKTY